ncbi:hypothetical protein ACQRBF_05820 [Peptoniphilaceae bacterium SGI.131]
MKEKLNWCITGISASMKIKEYIDVRKSCRVSMSIQTPLPNGLDRLDVYNKYWQMYEDMSMGIPILILTPATQDEVYQTTLKIYNELPVIEYPPLKGLPPDNIKELIIKAKALYNEGKIFEAYEIEEKVKKEGFEGYLFFWEQDDPF